MTFAYVGLLGAFSAAQVMLLTRRNRVMVGLWLGASFFSALGLVNTAHFLAASKWGDLSVYGVFASQTGGLLRFLALHYRGRSFNRNSYAEAFFLFSVLAMPLIVIPTLSPYRLMIGSAIGMSTACACGVAALFNPALKFANRQPVAMILFGMAVGVIGLLYRVLTAYPFTTDQTFVGPSYTQTVGLVVLIMISFVLQVGFTGVITEMRAREEALKDRSAVRISQRTLQLQERAVETARVAQARLDLVQILSHEVRQPISNAQASLQSINLKFRSLKQLPPGAYFALERAQNSLEDINLSLSNIIVASTIISVERKWDSQEIDAYEILEMSILDLPPAQQARIKNFHTDGAFYFESVSILLRLAFQNILHHATQFSRPDTDIDVNVSVDYSHELIVFDIGFIPASGELLSQSVFERRPISDTERASTSSLGLFVVRQIMRELGGEVQLLNPAPDYLNFRLTLAC
ncbi:MAG: HAMP domain-containing sensor histidine kinase [Sphingomonadales bacterium]